MTEDIVSTIRNNGILRFQFEANYAFSMLKKFKPESIHDMSLVNASIRPSGDSYRDDLMAGKFHKNPSEEIDKLLEKNRGYLVFQEDTILFLTEVCGLSGSEADNIRRAIGALDRKTINEAMPKILDGYCQNSNKPREVAEQEAKEFLQIIEDSSDYQFNFNHSVGYSMIGYMCAMLRYYHPLEFVTAFLNNADNEEDVITGTKLARDKNIDILPPKFGGSMGDYTPNKEDNNIYKGIASIKYLNHKIAEELFELSKNDYDTFTELLIDIVENTTVNTRQLNILIRIDFFDQFGDVERLLAIYDNFVNGEYMYKKTYVNATKAKRIPELIKWEKETDDIIKFSINERIAFENEHLGYTNLTLDVPKSQVIVSDIFAKYRNPVVTLYQLATGDEIVVKIKHNNFYNRGQALLDVGDHINIKGAYRDFRWRKDQKTGDFYQDKNEKELIVSSFDIIQKA